MDNPDSSYSFARDFQDPSAYHSNIRSEYFSGLPKKGVFLLGSIVAAVASLAFCSRSVSTTLLFILSVVIGRAAVGCFDEITIRTALDHYTWMSADFVEMLLILMPNLIFSTAYTLELHDFQRLRYQILILGVLCYFLDTVLLGLLTYLQMNISYVISDYTMPELRWSLISSFKYSTIACTADTIAVSTMLHQVWLPQPLYAMVKGEALVSNAFAVFNYHIINVTTAAPESGAATYIAQGIGFRIVGWMLSIAFGYVAGRMAAFILRRIGMDPIFENVFLLVFVYATYSVCRIFHAAGVAGLLVFAVTMNGYRKWMNRDRHETSKRFWTTLAFYSNSVTVILTGVTSSIYMKPWYYPHAVIAYLLSTLSRACVLIICTWLLRKVSKGGHPIEYTCFLICVSTRGVVSMLLGWRHYRDYRQHLWNVTSEGKEADLVLWLTGTTVAAGHFFQGGTIGWVAKKLGLAGISSADREHLTEFVIRLNKRIREKLTVRKALPRYAEADWSKIERNASLRLGDRKALGDRETLCAGDDGEQETEWHFRDAMQRLYDVDLWSMSHFGSLSLGLRQVQQVVNDATEAHGPLQIHPLIDQRPPFACLRRVFPRGGWSPRLVKKLIGERRSTWSDFWRLLCCSAAVVQAIAVRVTFISHGNLSNYGVFVSGTLALFNTVETLMRLWYQRNRLRHVYVRRKNVLDWLYVVSVPFYLSSIALHLYVYHNCAILPTSGPFQAIAFPIFLLERDCPDKIRYAFIGVTTIFWLQLPLAIVLLVRLCSYEVGHMWQSADERSFEILRALILLSSHVIEELKTGELAAMEPSNLRQRLIQENETIKNECEKDLNKLYRRSGGADTFAAIKTRRAAFDLLYDAQQFFQAAKQMGELNESEYRMAVSAVEQFRNNVHQWTVEKCMKRIASTRTSTS